MYSSFKFLNDLSCSWKYHQLCHNFFINMEEHCKSIILILLSRLYCNDNYRIQLNWRSFVRVFRAVSYHLVSFYHLSKMILLENYNWPNLPLRAPNAYHVYEYHVLPRRVQNIKTLVTDVWIIKKHVTFFTTDSDLSLLETVVYDCLLNWFDDRGSVIRNLQYHTTYNYKLWLIILKNPKQLPRISGPEMKIIPAGWAYVNVS